MSFVLPDPGAPNAEFERPADPARLERVSLALQARGFKAQVAASGAEARQIVLDGIPLGAEVHTALSQTVIGVGIASEIDESGRYDSLRVKLAQLDRETQAREMRKLGFLVVGHQKLVATLDEGLRRLREYSLPREYLRMQGAGYPGSLLAKALVVEREPRGRITVILVAETLGF